MSTEKEARYDVGPQEDTEPDAVTLDVVPTLVMNGGID
jgi:hypothetical protein